MATAMFSKFAGILSATLLIASYFRILNTSAGVTSLPLALLHEMFPWYIQFFWRELYSFSHSSVSSASLHCSSLLAILWNSAFVWMYLSLSSLLFASLLCCIMCKASSDNHFAFLHFFFFGMVLVTDYCTVVQTSVHSFSGILSTRSNPLNLFITTTV